MFVHRPYLPHETIVALATPPGEGAIAIIRLSGKEAISVASKIFSKDLTTLKSHTVHFGSVRTLDKIKIDEALAIVMRAPKTFTGEDCVEIQCHGGRLVSAQVLEAAIEAGARAAMPGEFCFQAFMNGKIDLTQAEAIQALICSKNENGVKIAQDQLDGALSRRVEEWQKRLSDIAAIFEAWVDFPEEDLEFLPFAEVKIRLSEVAGEIKKLVDSFQQGRIIHDGVQLAIVGAPNVGKSSLMNALLGKDRAIVSPHAGTTRDLVEDDLRFGHLHLRLIDTAGIRSTNEEIEEEGIKRSRKAIERADIVLFILDATEPDIGLFEDMPKEKTIAVWNKIDLPHTKPLPKLPFQYVVEISAKTHLNIEELKKEIDKVALHGHLPEKGEIVITQKRHKEALKMAFDYLEAVIKGLDSQISPEFLSIDLRGCLNELGTIRGTAVTEDILHAIFSQFCIGK
jgi:tRNA modification GTPase